MIKQRANFVPLMSTFCLIFVLFFGAFQAVATERERITPENVDRLVEIASIGRPSIEQVIWTPNGEHIIAITGIGYYVYEVDLSHEPQVFETDFAGRLNFLLSPNGRYLVGFEDSFGSNQDGLRRDVWVWDVGTGELAFATETLFDDTTMPLDITGAMFFPNRSTLLLISMQGDLHEWNLDNPTTMTHLADDDQGWDSRFSMYRFSSEGQWLARLQNGLRIWDTTTWEVVVEMDDLRYDAFDSAIVFNGTGTQALLATFYQDTAILDGSTIRLINLPSGHIVWEQDLPHSVPAFDEQNMPIAMVSEQGTDVQIQGKIQLVNLQNGEIRWERPGEGFIRGTFDQHSSLFIGRVGDPNGIDIWIRDVNSGNDIMNERFPHDVVFDLSPDSSRIVISSGFSGDSQNWRSIDSRLQVWDLTNGELISENLDHSYSIYEPIFSPNSRYLAMGGKDELRLWDTLTWQISSVDELNEISPRLYYYPTEFSNDSRLILGTVESTNGSIFPTAWQVDDGTILDTRVDNAYIRQLDASGTLLATITHEVGIEFSYLTIRRYPSFDMIHLIPVGHRVEQSRFSPDSSLIAAYTRDGWLGVWDVRTGNERLFVHTRKEGNWFIGNDLSIDEQHRWLLNREGSTEMWNIVTGESWGEAYTIEFSPNSNTFAAVTGDEFSLRLYDAETGEVLADSIAIENVTNVAFSPDGRILAIETHHEMVSGYFPSGRSVSLYDIATGTEILSLEDHELIYDPIFSPDGTMLAVQAAGRRLIVYGIEED
jgi:WD40 repeat protein